ncbi:MAG TPA: THUMP domain-containing protein [Candidatus Nanoarchaeia archaeon]|nr:THUMP domain-containing protein [Candidatus Nanoarchaeia archaeon]
MKTKCLSIVSRGLERIAGQEIKEICKVDAVQKSGCVAFEVGDIKELCRFSYLTQSCDRVLLLLDEFEFSENPFEKIKDSLEKKPLPEGAYKVLSIRRGIHSFNSDDVMRNVGTCLNQLGKEIDLRNPDNLLVVFIRDSTCCVGLDLAQLDLHKREYRIFTSPSDIRGTIAYAMVRFSGFKEGDILLDPFCNSGTIVIEAALYATKRSPRFYEKAKLKNCKIDFEKIDSKIKKSESKITAVDANHRNVVATKKNSKIAGIVKDIDFSRSDVEWMDIKFEKGSIDRIVTKLPAIRKEGNREKMLKILDEFFYNGEYVLGDNGKMAIMTENIEDLKPLVEKHHFVIKEEIKVDMGKEEKHIYIIEKSSSGKQ